ncbi:TPA: DUF1761 domain-containing protein [Candidatus Woesearchaeota archaeon]|nr:MAG: hypothetical protein QT04_C0033G0005 [archaeon GW2011_AR11]MBS3111185.1 DUF1761 domain-containing protein [Candidatus Woesearchaeota archaeon]HIH05197.1 DUF1761 domain-containing protein [Candidatus Woesearchaeota archaeon]HIH91551.1 DUF1761 domain-containing protein [Candidatus Woesearchaeota archaeon]HII64770.1 DUF1761 domain-containing protein [Candidatus Woesearchaeota archaeon]
MEATINYLAVALAALAAMALGWLWYSPVMFQKRWMKEVGMKPKDAARAQQEGVKAMGFMFLATLVMAYVLAHFVDYLGATDAREALWAGSWIWVGFVATVMLQPVFFERKSWTLYLINTAYNLVSLLVMAVILVVLQ